MCVYPGVAFSGDGFILCMKMIGMIYKSAFWSAISLTIFFGLCFSIVTANAQETTTELSEREQERILNLGANVTNRMEAMVFRLTDINDRILKASRNITEYPEAVRYIEGQTGHALSLLTNANSILKDADARMQNVVSSGDPVATWRKIRPSFLEVKGLLRDSRDELFSAALTLKDPASYVTDTDETVPEISASTTATTTVTTNASSTSN